MSKRKVKKIVVLMRHGIRAPNQTMDKLAEWSHREWPVWSVPPGHLTGRGRELITAFWRRHKLEEPYKSLLSDGGGCVTADNVFVHADIDERTQSSAVAFAAAIAPECSLPYFITTDKDSDPLYHPVRGSVCQLTREVGEDDIINFVGHSFSKLGDKFSEQLDFVNELLGPMPQITCNAYGVEQNCELKDLPPRVNFANSGRTINLRGALGIKATLIQNWLLESAEWPDKDPGWGEITSDKLSKLLVARAAIFNSLNRASGYARDRGSVMLKVMTDALTGTHHDQRVNQAQLVVFVGHDTNMAHVSELLGMDWDLEGFAYNDIPPASFLQFILWEEPSGKEVVTAEFVAQPLAVMRSDHPERELPYEIVKNLSFCPREKGTLEPRVTKYSLEKFCSTVTNVINLDCVPKIPPLVKGELK